MTQPLVSIICLCYNQKKFIEQAIDSVAQQTYSSIECILVDDCSTDGSRIRIQEIAARYPWIRIIQNDKNLGMCMSFNKAFALSKGEYIIDLAADDVMHRERVAAQVECFQKHPEQYGVVFTDAWLMNEKGLAGRKYYDPAKNIPAGDVFVSVVKSYFICSPTIMVKRAVFEELGGYNPELVYEDYDFFIRSSRNWLYAFLDKPLVFRRIVQGSDSSRWYKPFRNPHLSSTLTVCKATVSILKNEKEKEALAHSVAYHWRQTVFLQVRNLEPQYFGLLKSLRPIRFNETVLHALSGKIPFARLYLSFHYLRSRIKKATRSVAFTMDYKSLW